MRWFTRQRRWVKILLTGLLIMVALMFVSALIAAHDSSRNGLRTNNLVKAGSAGSQPNPYGNAVTDDVPTSRVPTTVRAAQNSASDALTPDRWQSDPVPTTKLPQLPTATQTQIVDAVSTFLDKWETFKAGQYAGPAQQNAWAAALKPLISPVDYNTVIGRSDSHAPSFICPLSGCNTGSQFLPQVVNPSQAAQIRAFTGTSAYVVTSGAVVYRGTSDLNRVAYYRSYGVILTLVNGHWLVTRAAADTSGRVE